MKPPPFDYRRASTLEEALHLLAEAAPDGKVIAGGQSLVPMLNLRLARPDVLIDIGRIPGLRYLHHGPSGFRVGALTRHDQLECYPTTIPGFDVLRHAARFVGHHPIRTRGTVGGSLAHADGAAEWCILSVLLEAQIVARSVRGSVVYEAETFYRGLFETALEPDEIVVEVWFRHPRRHAALEEFSRRHGDFAVVAAAVGFDVHEGLIVDPRVVLGGVSARPERCTPAEDVLRGVPAAAVSFAEAGEVAAASIEPPEDLHATPDVRRRLASTLVRRACERALTAEHEVV